MMATRGISPFGRLQWCLAVAVMAIFLPQLIPQSEQLVLTERFTPTADGARLAYQSSIEYPVYRAEPAKSNDYWIWRRGNWVEPYRCAETTAAAKAAAGR